jgi:hypothetical protein
VYVVSGPGTTTTCPVTVRRVGDGVEELDTVLGSAGTDLEDLTVTLPDESPVGHALCDGSGIVRHVKLEPMVDLTERT